MFSAFLPDGVARIFYIWTHLHQVDSPGPGKKLTRFYYLKKNFFYILKDPSFYLGQVLPPSVDVSLV